MILSDDSLSLGEHRAAMEVGCNDFFRCGESDSDISSSWSLDIGFLPVFARRISWMDLGCPPCSDNLSNWANLS